MPAPNSSTSALADLPLSTGASESDLDAIERRLASLEGVRRVRLCKDRRRARVGFDPAQVSIEALRQAARPDQAGAARALAGPPAQRTGSWRA